MRFLHFHWHNYVPIRTVFEGNDTIVTSACDCTKLYKYKIRNANLTLKDITGW